MFIAYFCFFYGIQFPDGGTSVVFSPFSNRIERLSRDDFAASVPAMIKHQTIRGEYINLALLLKGKGSAECRDLLQWKYCENYPMNVRLHSQH
jgi:tartrate dehydratase alpha subunit/fumarate hydratase class I-like protein